jgi:hypothetical protein
MEEKVILVENYKVILKYVPKTGVHDAKSFKSKRDDLQTLCPNCN